MALALIQSPTWGTVSTHHFSGINKQTVTDPFPVLKVVVAVADQVENSTLRNAPRGLWVMDQGNLSSPEFEFGIRPVQRDLGETVCYLLL